MRTYFSAASWPVRLGWIISLLVTGFILTFRLSSLLPLTLQESLLPASRILLHNAWHTPVMLPYTAAQISVNALHLSNSLFAARLPSVLTGVIIIGLLFWVMRRWYGQRLALFGGVLLITAPWVLHAARSAGTLIMYPLAMTVCLTLAVAWHRKTVHRWLLYLSALLVAATLYIPGSVWLLLIVLAIEFRPVLTSIKLHRLDSVLSCLLGLILLVPLAHSIITTPALARLYAGLLPQLPNIGQFGHNFVAAWLHIFIGHSLDATTSIPGTPIVDILTTVGFIIGIYLYAKHPKAQRSLLLMGLWVIATVLVAFGMVSILVLLPIVAVLSIGGIGYLLHLWLKVFPRNPLARAMGIGLITLLVASSLTYNVRNYFVAWPHDPVVRSQLLPRL